ncbi:hypothetical protein [Microvirga zambiensis]|uniref:hypothetical protein n=1 Tax=Microvirga zambiensis TaxID=1402137 RepID=UPI0019201A7C|nr:hypothetical protein [Microvirga zambiensis]
MGSFPYPWGKMRPTAWRNALKHQLNEIASLKIDATTAYRRVVGELERKDQVIRQQLEFLDKVTSGGKYNSQVAEDLLRDYRHVLLPNDQTEVHDRSDPHRLRKSRAKVRVTKNSVMDIMRGVSPPDSGAGGDHIVIHTASESPLGLEQPIPAGQQSDNNGLDQKHPTFESSDSGEAALEAERQEQVEKVARQNAFVSFEGEATEECKQMCEGRRCYDFSDPCDEERFPLELTSLYPNFEKTFNLTALVLIEDMPEDDYKAWVKVVRYGHLPEDEQEEKLCDAMTPYRDMKSFIKNGKNFIWKDIQREHARRTIWPWIRLRFEFVDTLMLDRASNSFTEDDLDALAKFDYMVEGQASADQRRQYAQIIDLLQWPKETSRRELILRADPAYDLDLLYDYDSLLDYSSDAGPAKNIPVWRRMREPRPSSVDDALIRLYERSGEARLV